MNTVALTVLIFLSGGDAGAVEAARAYRHQHGAGILREFVELLEIPNVASDRVNIRRNAAHIRDMLTRRGVEVALLTLDDAPPIVFGRLEAPGADRTLGIYVHYDGQPANESKWTHPPFEPVLYTAAMDTGGRRRPFPKEGEEIDPEWRLYARAAGDDKAPIIAVVAALDALKASGISPSVNLILFFEGEEEVGSPHLAQYLQRYRERLDPVDFWLICDGPVHQSRRPQIVFGVRGITGMEITVYGATRYLHSGHYGGWAPNPALMLSQLLASMQDDDGHVLIGGFYDSVTPVSETEKAAIAALREYDAAMRRELGLARTLGDNARYAQRLLRPALNVRGLATGTVGATARNVIPNEAIVSVDIRLVKGNDPAKMLEKVEAHIRKQGYHVVREDPDHKTRLANAKIAKVMRQKGYPAARTSMDHPMVDAIVRAADRAAGQPVVRLPTLGGSLPIYLFTDDLKKPAVIVPIVNHDNNQHAPDENIRVANLWYGIDLMAALMTMPGK